MGPSIVESSGSRSHHSYLRVLGFGSSLLRVQDAAGQFYVFFNRIGGLHVRVIVMSSCWVSGKATSLCLRPFFPGTTLLRTL